MSNNYQQVHSDDNSPIVITGCPRSGTQMMGRVFGNLSDDICLITEHSDKSADVPEEKAGVEDHRLWWEAFDYAAWDQGRGVPAIDMPIPRSDSIERIRERYLKIASGRRIIIKNPSHILYPQLVRSVFPTAKFVFCIRDPWPTLQSMTKAGRESFLLRSPRVDTSSYTLLRNASIGWNDAFEAFRNHCDTGWAIARYEDIVETPRESIARLCEQLEIGSSESIERASEVPQPSANSSYHFIKKAIATSIESKAIQAELRAGCDHFNYSLTPDHLPGDAISDLAVSARNRVRRAARKLSRYAASML